MVNESYSQSANYERSAGKTDLVNTSVAKSAALLTEAIQKRSLENSLIQDATFSQQVLPSAGKRTKAVTRLELPSPRRLSGVVKVIFDSQTGSVRLVGSPADIKIVEATISAVRKMNGMDPYSTARITLSYQLADVVVELLQKTLAAEIAKNPRVKIHSVHFPESVVLVGPKSFVDKAKKLIKTIDSHPDFPSVTKKM